MGRQIFKSKFREGDLLKDVVTGFEGVVMGITFYFTGCNHYGLQRTKTKTDGGIADYEWIDESRLKLIKTDEVSFKRERDTSGPHPIDGAFGYGLTCTINAIEKTNR